MNKFAEVLENPTLTIAQIEHKVAPLRAAMQNEQVRRQESPKNAKKTAKTAAFTGRTYPNLPGQYWEVEDLLAA